MSKIKKSFTLCVFLQGMILLALLMFSFGRARCLATVSESEIWLSGTEGNMHSFCSDAFLLQPGIYDIEILADKEQQYDWSFEIEKEQDCYKGILSNAVPMFRGKEKLNYSIWVLHKIPVHVKCTMPAEMDSPVFSAKIHWTAKGFRVLFLLFGVVFIVLDGMILFRRAIIEGRVSQKRQIVFWVMLLGILLSFFPLLGDYCFIGADDLFHMTRIQGLAESIRDGVGFPIRVQSYWNYGHGYAVSMFYGDLLLFFPAVLLLIGFPFYMVYKCFIFCLLAGSAIVAYYSFYRCLRDEYAALVGSMVYLLIPYHLLNIYNRGAMGECCAFVFLPLVFCGAYLLLREKPGTASYRRIKWYLVIGFSGLINSHVITTEMTVLALGAFCLIFWRRTFRKQTFIQFFEAAILSLLINVWFWLPLLYMMGADQYHLQTIISLNMQERGLFFASFFQLLLNKGSAQTGMYQNEPVQLGVGLAMAYIVYLIWRGKRKESIRIESGLFGGSMLVFVVMSTRYLPWNAMMRIPVLGKVISSFQFPARWMVLATLFAAAFAMFFFSEIKERGGILIKTALGLAAVLMVVSAIYQVNSIAYNTTPRYLYDAKNFGTISVGNGEYLLQEVESFGLDLYYHDPVAEEGLSWSSFVQKGTKIKMNIKNETDQMKAVELPLMGYKGYGVKSFEVIDCPEGVPVISNTVGAHGDLRVEVPAGFEGGIEVFYQGFWFFRLAELVSVLSILTILISECCHWGKIHESKRMAK